LLLGWGRGDTQDRATRRDTGASCEDEKRSHTPRSYTTEAEEQGNKAYLRILLLLVGQNCSKRAEAPQPVTGPRFVQIAKPEPDFRWSTIELLAPLEAKAMKGGCRGQTGTLTGGRPQCLAHSTTQLRS